MPTEYKDQRTRRDFRPVPASPRPAAPPARPEPADEAPGAFLNPGPKAAMIGLALLVLAAYAHFAGGLGGRTEAGPPPLTTPRESPNAPPTPPQTQPQSPLPPDPPTPDETVVPDAVEPDAAAQEAHREKLARLARAPRLLSGQTFNNDALDGLSLQNATVSRAVFQSSSLQKAAFYRMRFKDCVFNGTDLSKANIREVSFENCTFTDSNIDEAVLFNVNFLGCSFSSGKLEQGIAKGRIALSRLSNVLFENAALNTFELFQVSGRVTFKDTDLSGLRLRADGGNVFYPRESAAAVQFRLNLENCTGGDFELSLRNLSSELKISASELDNVKLGSFGKIQITESSVTGQGFIEAREWLVVENSTLCADFKAYGPMYLVNNAYVDQRSTSRVNAFLKDDDGLHNTSKIRPAGDGPCYISGGADGAWLTTFGGKIFISDLDIRLGYFEIDNSTRQPSELNLKNVRLDKGHIYNSELGAAYWENVAIAHPLTSRNLRTQKPLAVRMANVELPQGRWIDSDLYSIEEVAPRPWPRPEIPELK